MDQSTNHDLDRLAKDVRLVALPVRIRFGVAAFLGFLFVGIVAVFSILYALGFVLRFLKGL